MRLRPAHIVLVACATLALALPSVAEAAKAPARVRLTECRTGDKPSERTATFHAQMSAIPGTARMAMRFVLFQGTGSKDDPVVPAPLKPQPWRTSHRGVRHFGFTQKITRLEAGNSYRMRVQFRWFDGDGHVLLQARRTSGACAQPGELPNLRIASVVISPGSSDAVRTYSVRVNNAGKGVAHDFTVALFVDGALADSRRIDRLGSHESSTVQFSGQPCRHRLRAVADYGKTVRETNEYDNSLSSAC